MAGRRPKPAEEKRRAGNPGKRRIPDDEPVPVPGTPKRPAFLTGEARREWDRLVAILEGEHRLSLSEAPALEKLCVAHARWMRLRAVCDSPTTKLLVKTEIGEKPNPVFQMERLASEQCRKLYNDFGLTPGTRARVRTGHKPKDPTAAKEAKFFSRPALVKGNRPRG